MYRDVMPPAAGGPIKNASQMMESEGVIATLFYRLATDPRLQQVYREPAFYEGFLQPDEVAILRDRGPSAVIEPAANVYLKMFDVMHRSFTWGDWPALAFVSAYVRQFPDEAPAVYDVFLDVTRGVTVDRAAPTRQIETGYLTGLRDRLLSGALAIDAAQPPPLWMTSPGIEFGLGIFRYFPVPSSFTLDLNAADDANLRSVPHVSGALAAAIIRAREAKGGFDSVNALSSVSGMTPDLLAEFRTMKSRMDERLSTPRTGGGDAGWFSRLLVPLLRGSYYAAGAWQVGQALALAGGAFALVAWIVGVLVPGIRVGAQAPARRWWRRVLRAFARGVLAATLPCLASAALYGWDVMPTPTIMAALGVVLGGLTAVGLIAVRRLGIDNHLAVARVILATTAAAAVMGFMY